MSIWIRCLPIAVCVICSASLSAFASGPEAFGDETAKLLSAVDGVNGKLSFEGEPTYGGRKVYGVS